MALVIPGKTRCSICDTVIGGDEDWVGLLHSLRPDHPLWRFSDSAAHRRCYDGWKYRGYFDRIREKWEQIVSSRPPLPFPSQDRQSLTATKLEANAKFIGEREWGRESVELGKFLDELDRREGFDKHE